VLRTYQSHLVSQIYKNQDVKFVMYKIIFVAQFSVTPQFQDRLFFRNISGKLAEFGSKFDNLTDSYFIKFCNVFSISHVVRCINLDD